MEAIPWEYLSVSVSNFLESDFLSLAATIKYFHEYS